MLGIVGAIAGLIKVRSSQTLVDDAVFRLHYRWTTALCFISCALVATSDLVGNPIECLMDGEEAPKPITTYCWVSSTFTINTTNAYGQDDYDMHGSSIHGIGPYDPAKHEKRVHGYYQWVPFVLFILGCMFYLPHLIWKEVEGKRITCILQGLNVLSFDETNDLKKKNIIKYMHESQGRLNGRYAFGYFFVQLLNFIMVISTMFILQSFFGGVFMDYGSMVIQYLNGHPDAEQNPMILAFPRIGKCTFHLYGSSGSLQSRDVMCLLPQNIMNEKIFLVLWFWLILLLTVTSINIIFLAVQFISPYIRLKTIEQYGKMVSSGELENYLFNAALGDYFLLANLAKNLDAITFRDILESLVSKNRQPISSNTATLEQPRNMFSPHAPSYRHFNIDDDIDDPAEYKRRMAAAEAECQAGEQFANGNTLTADSRV